MRKIILITGGQRSGKSSMAEQLALSLSTNPVYIATAYIWDDEFAERVRKTFNDIAFEKAGHRSVSIGVTEILDGESADAACVRVDQALYQAKDGGKNRVVVI